NEGGESGRGGLTRVGLADDCDVVVAGDEMRELKPHPDGWRVISERVDGATAAGRPAVYMVGDSWVDGLAAAAVGVPFIAYRARPGEFERWKIEPVATLTDLATLPERLAALER